MSPRNCLLDPPAPTVEAINRREFISGALAAALLAACGQKPSETPEETSRRVKDLFGTVTVPNRPERLIAGEDVTLNNMLVLGVKPVGGFIYADSLIRHTSHLLPADYVDLRAEGELNLEKALTLDPDLLIALGGTKENPRNQEACAKWRQAMPTFCYEYNFIYEEQIKNNVLELGRALNLENKAEAVISDFDDRVADMKRKVRDAGFTDKPVSVVRVLDANTYAIRIGTLESIVFRAIGIPQPEGQRDPLKFQVEISSENLEVLNESYALVVYADDDDFRGRQSVTQPVIRDHPVWQALTPVKEGRVVFLPPWNGADLPKALTIMDEIEEHLLPLAKA
jgi:iron complex transport system substrate-binding protein